MVHTVILVMINPWTLEAPWILVRTKKDKNILRVVQTQAILALKSMSERVGTDKERL